MSCIQIWFFLAALALQRMTGVFSQGTLAHNPVARKNVFCKKRSMLRNAFQAMFAARMLSAGDFLCAPGRMDVRSFLRISGISCRHGVCQRRKSGKAKISVKGAPRRAFSRKGTLFAAYWHGSNTRAAGKKAAARRLSSRSMNPWARDTGIPRTASRWHPRLCKSFWPFRQDSC